MLNNGIIELWMGFNVYTGGKSRRIDEIIEK